MANDFKNAIAQNASTSGTVIYTTPATKTSIMLELDIANTTNNVVEGSVEVLDSSVSSTAWRYLVKNAPVPSGGSLMVIAGQKIVLEAGDKVRVTASAANVLDVVAAILEDVNS
jgi:hypothetical protein